MEHANYNTLLDTLKELHNIDTFKAKLLSSDITIELKKLKLDQQRDIIKSITDSRLSDMLFNIAISNIIKDNYTGDKELHIIDIPLLALTMRCESIGDKLSITSEDDSTHELNLRDHIARISEKKLPKGLLRATFHTDIPAANKKIVAKCRVPSVDTDIAINQESLQVIRDSIESDSTNISEVVGRVIIHETLKYIESISINSSELSEDGESITSTNEIKFDDLHIQQRVSIMETLPAIINSNISEYIDSITEFKDSLTVIGENSINIEITPNIFISDK